MGLREGNILIIACEVILCQFSLKINSLDLVVAC